MKRVLIILMILLIGCQKKHECQDLQIKLNQQQEYYNETIITYNTDPTQNNYNKVLLAKQQVEQTSKQIEYTCK